MKLELLVPLADVVDAHVFDQQCFFWKKIGAENLEKGTVTHFGNHAKI